VSGTNGDLIELEHVPFMPGSCPWTFVDLNQRTSGAPPQPYGSFSELMSGTAFVRADGTAEVLYQAASHNIYGLVYQPSGTTLSWQVDPNTPNHDGDITPTGP
jgi:hypothetical protein